MSGESLCNGRGHSQNSVIPAYKYESIISEGLQIRLLTLAPADSWTSDIQCRLTHIKLSFELKFEALSYTWDNGVGTHPINLDGHQLLVTPNLESFLRHRRQKTEAVDLWVDAVCINQADIVEKSEQVSMMNLIYATAYKVLVWLGPAADDSDLAMDELRILGSGSPYDKMPILSGDLLRAMEKLLSRRWWHRIWILQEVY
jgi:hypothetical protein